MTMTNTIWKRLVHGTMGAMALLVAGCFCGAGPGQTEASLYVSDGVNGASVKAPVFSERGALVSSRCGEVDRKDASICLAQLLILSPGQHEITVQAEGYVEQTVTVDTSAIASMHLAVEMARAE
jgi:hypothetical protein